MIGMIHRFRVILGDYFLMEQMEAVLSRWARKDLRTGRGDAAVRFCDGDPDKPW
jgi:hypothetical protein